MREGDGETYTPARYKNSILKVSVQKKNFNSLGIPGNMHLPINSLMAGKETPNGFTYVGTVNCKRLQHRRVFSVLYPLPFRH